MSTRNHYYMPWNNQEQDQHQGQAEAQLQGQLQGQGQHQSQSSENENGNENGNLNGSLNLNGNANGNLNFNENDAANSASNSATNAANNTTDVHTVVDTDVSVSANVDLSGYAPTDDDFADIDMSHMSVNDIIMAKGDVNYDPGNELNMKDILTDALNGEGNDSGTINGQFNNLVDNDSLHNATVGGSLTQTNTSSGGTATSDDGIDAGSEDGEGGFGGFPHMQSGFDGGHGGYGDDDDNGLDSGNWGSSNGDDGYVSGQSMSSAASAIDTTAFNQSIVMGANVLGNTVDMTIVGGNMTSTYVGDDSSDGA
ncbi:hypothetical protein [Yoonia sp.]|uniref:hypothetical protein n=1 Tax=Yoonia sp. TaxID=2212373 RepID=UPI0025E2F6D6|nr:hypothetical protein [Yoonia sp.]